MHNPSQFGEVQNIPSPFGRQNKVKLLLPNTPYQPPSRTGRSNTKSAITKEDLSPKNGEYGIEIKRDFPHARAILWHLMTDPEGLAEWAPFDAHQSLDSPPGQAIILIQAVAAPASDDFEGENKDKTITHHAPLEMLESEIIACDSPRLVAFNWGGDYVRFELTEIQNELTELTLTHYVAEAEYLTKIAAGWHICLDVAFMVLAGNNPGRIVGEDALKYGWGKLDQQYAQKFMSQK